MAHVVGSRFAIKAGTAVGAVGLAVVALTPVGAPQAAASTVHYAYVVNSSSNTCLLYTSDAADE